MSLCMTYKPGPNVQCSLANFSNMGTRTCDVVTLFDLLNVQTKCWMLFQMVIALYTIVFCSLVNDDFYNMLIMKSILRFVFYSQGLF